MLKKGCGCGLLLLMAATIAVMFFALNSTEPNAPPSISPGESIDLFTKLGVAKDGAMNIHCYGFSRVGSKEEIIDQAKALVKTMTPGRDVAYIFTAKDGVSDFIRSRENNERWTPKLEKWMKDYHFAQIAHMNGSRWELIQWSDAAERKFNNKMVPIPLSDSK